MKWSSEASHAVRGKLTHFLAETSQPQEKAIRSPFKSFLCENLPDIFFSINHYDQFTS